MRTLASIEMHLRLYRVRAEKLNGSDADVEAAIEQTRVAAVAAGDQPAAKHAWCLATTLGVQQQYVSAFRELKHGAFYEAWCTFERVEIALTGLERHMPLDPSFGLDVIDRMVPQFQSLYPYKIFLSPSFIEKERKCSICDQPITLRRRCEHVVGEIYDGRKCLNIITASEVLEMSFVDEPVQKYSVPFMRDARTGQQKDQYDYSLVEYVTGGLANPYDSWSVERGTRRHPHARYKHVGRNDLCPCEGGKKYKVCCLREEGVLRPHIDIKFDKPLAAPLPAVQYSRSA
jgi:hypothetical protein